MDEYLEEITKHQLHVESKATALTPMLRWKSGVLEQAWNITTFEHGLAIREDTEWRPVPQA